MSDYITITFNINEPDSVSMKTEIPEHVQKKLAENGADALTESEALALGALITMEKFIAQFASEAKPTVVQ